MSEKQQDMWLERIGASFEDIFSVVRPDNTDNDGLTFERIRWVSIPNIPDDTLIDVRGHRGFDRQSVSIRIAKEHMEWGTLGVYGSPTYGRLRWVKLKDCDDDHLLNILKTQHQITETTKHVIWSILKDRGMDSYAVVEESLA